MQPVIMTLAEKKLVGKRVTMSLAENKTPALWRSFLPHRKAIKNSVSNDLISMSTYSEPLVMGKLDQKFHKWAAIEVSNFEAVPDKMETYILKSGLYAVFRYKGLSTDNKIFVYIYGMWLPNSNYDLDDRPFFEVLGDNYENGNPNSEEDIYIPIKPKQQLSVTTQT